MRNAEFAFQSDPVGRNQRGEGGAEFAAGGELVIGAAAEGLCGIVAAQQPDRSGFRRLLRQFGEIDEGADRRMSGAQHRDGLAGIARAVLAEHVRHPVGDPAGGLRLADGGEAVGAGRIGRVPGAGGIDDRVRPHDLGALAVLIADFERRGFAAPGLELVEAGAADIGDAAVGMNVARENGPGGERFEVALNQFGAGRILIRLGRIPSRRRQQARRRAIDIVFPGREQLDVAPLPHRMPGAVARFQHDRPKPPLQHMRRRGEPDRAGADDRHRLCLAHGILPSNQKYRN